MTKLPAKQEKKQYVTPKQLACYMLKLAGVSIKDISKKLELTENSVIEYASNCNVVLRDNCPSLDDARKWQMSILPAVTEHLSKRVFKNDALLSKYMEGIGVWNKNIDINVKVIDLTTEELMGIIGEEAAKNPKIKALQEQIGEYTVLEDDNERPNSRDDRQDHSNHNDDTVCLRAGVGGSERHATVKEDQDDTNSNNAGTGADSVPIPGQELRRPASVEEDSHGNVDNNMGRTVNTVCNGSDKAGKGLKPLGGGAGTFKGIKDTIICRSEGSALQSSEGSRIPKENIGLSLSSQNINKEPLSTVRNSSKGKGGCVPQNISEPPSKIPTAGKCYNPRTGDYDDVPSTESGHQCDEFRPKNSTEKSNTTITSNKYSKHYPMSHEDISDLTVYPGDRIRCGVCSYEREVPHPMIEADLKLYLYRKFFCDDCAKYITDFEIIRKKDLSALDTTDEIRDFGSELEKAALERRIHVAYMEDYYKNRPAVLKGEPVPADRIHVDEDGKRWLLTELPPELSRETLKVCATCKYNHRTDFMEGEPESADEYTGKVCYNYPAEYPDLQPTEPWKTCDSWSPGKDEDGKVLVYTQSNTQSVPDGTGGDDGRIGDDTNSGSSVVHSDCVDCSCDDKKEAEQADRPAQPGISQSGIHRQDVEQGGEDGDSDSNLDRVVHPSGDKDGRGEGGIKQIKDKIQQACEPTEPHEPVKRKRGRPARRPYKWSKKGKPNKYNRRK